MTEVNAASNFERPNFAVVTFITFPVDPFRNTAPDASSSTIQYSTLYCIAVASRPSPQLKSPAEKRCTNSGLHQLQQFDFAVKVASNRSNNAAVDSSATHGNR